MKYQFFARAGARTQDPGLIRPMLYRLSYTSKNSLHSGGFEPPKLYAAELKSAPFDHSGKNAYCSGISFTI